MQRDVNITFINEVTTILEKYDIPIFDVLKAANTKWNLGNYKPGLVGGHYIGVDPYYFIKFAKDLNVDTKLISTARETNEKMSKYFAAFVDQKLKKLNKLKKRIIVLGITFKENVKDLRNTKVIDLVKALKGKGYDVDVHDANLDPKEVKTINRLVLDYTGVLPARIIFSKRNSIPRSDIGKLLRYKCKSLYENNNFAYLYKHDASDASSNIKNINNIAESLVSIISHVTGWNDITLQSEISLIGIDSLAATRISAQRKSLLKVTISMSDILASNTIAELIEKIEKERKTSIDDLTFFVDSQMHLEEIKRIPPACLQKEIILAENNNQANAPNENVYFEIDVSGKFDLEILKSAFFKLVEHQKQLSCVFVKSDSDFFQEYVSYPDSYFQIFDSAKFSKEKISKIISNEISKFFDYIII